MFIRPALLAAAVLQSAAAQQQARPVPDRDIYGAQMMTPEERDAYRRRLAAAQSPQERERVEREHRERMIERSKARGERPLTPWRL